MEKSDTCEITQPTAVSEDGDHCANIAGTCEPSDTRLTQVRSGGVLVSISDREMMALNALAGTYEDYYLNFKAIARRSGLRPEYVRRSVRALARKGLAEYGKGLWTDEGDLAGSGYRATAPGRARATKPVEEYCE